MLEIWGGHGHLGRLATPTIATAYYIADNFRVCKEQFAQNESKCWAANWFYVKMRKK